jgi:hypothetical protein
LLCGSRAQKAHDELPEIVLPSELATRLPDAWSDIAASVSPDLALRFELAAALHDVTIDGLVTQPRATRFA